MNSIQLSIWVAAFLVALLFFFSLVEACINRLSRVSLRVLAEKENSSRLDLLEEIDRNRSQFLLPLQFGNQVLQVGIAVLVTASSVLAGVSYSPLWALLIMVGVVSMFRQLIPKLLAHRAPERILLKLLPFFTGFHHLLRWLSAPLLASLRATHDTRNGRNGKDVLPAQEEEATDEEIQAYIGVGEEEGIFESNDSELIQSALEFGNILVREIMTPRSEIVAVEEDSSLAQLRTLMVSSKHSRIPVYKGGLNNIVGVVYVRNLLARLEEGRGDEPITPLINEAWVVPETKKVSELLKEMQSEAEHIAVVINEYGAVSGLVTMEDLVEEIVGEIRDEDESLKLDLVYEGEGNFIVRGSVEIGSLEEALEVDFGEPDVSTVSGLVVAHLGKVPMPGESIFIENVSIEILSSDRRKIHTMRIRKASETVRE